MSANLERDIADSSEIKELLQDDTFANELYAALCNVDWFKDGDQYSASWRHSGAVVAQFRFKNEDYMDFYCNGAEGTVSERVKTALGKLGWTYKICGGDEDL